MLTIYCPRCKQTTTYPNQYPHDELEIYRICTSCRVAGEKANSESGLRTVAKIHQKFTQQEKQGLLIKEE